MIIKVGSENKNKIEAVRQVIENYDFLKQAQVEGCKVSSGVSDQPSSLEETIQGAINRAKNAFQNCTYSVGLESGMIPVQEGKSKRYFQHTICSIYDGNKYSLGFSPAFELPIKAVDLIIYSGFTLEEATKEMKLTDNQEIGKAEGIIGILTQGKVTRIDYTKPAIQMALIHLQNPELYSNQY